MAQHPEKIEKLVERSSLGDADARRARSRVTDATARALLHRVRTISNLPTNSARARSNSARSAKFHRSRGTDIT